MSPAAGPAPGGSSRRSVLRAVGLGGSLVALAGVSGCGLRLEHVAAPPPPARVPAPDETPLLRTLTAVASLASLAGRVRPVTPASTRLASVHRAQVVVVRDRLRTAGVPDEVTRAASVAPTPSDPSTPAPSGSSPSGSPAPAPTPTATPSRPTTAAVLRDAESTAVSDLLTALPHLGPANRPLVAAVAACAAAAASELGRPVTWPEADPLPAAVAADLLDASRAAAYGLEVAAARLQGSDRAAVLTTLTVVRRRVRSLETAAGRAAGRQPLGYALPFPATDATAVRRLVTHVLSALVSDGLAPLTTAAVASGSTAVTTVVRLEAEALDLARTWGVPPTPFPGMTLA